MWLILNNTINNVAQVNFVILLRVFFALYTCTYMLHISINKSVGHATNCITYQMLHMGSSTDIRYCSYTCGLRLGSGTHYNCPVHTRLSAKLTQNGTW